MRRIAVFCTALAAAGVLASGASAVAPTKTSFSYTNLPNMLSGVCSFDITISTNFSGTEIDYFNPDGTLARVYQHSVEQDTFSVNGKSITGEPYVTNAELLFDSTGNITHIYASGLISRLVLPSGTLFLSAGHVFLEHPGVTFLLSPDVGKSGDVAAFCAALS